MGTYSVMARSWSLPLVTACVGLVILPVSLCFDWYEVTVHGAQGVSEGVIGLTGWRAFELVDAVLVLLAVAGLIVVTAESRSATQASRWGPLVLGGVAVLLVALQLLTEPSVLGPYPLPESSPRFGAWLALAAAALVVVAGVVNIARRPTPAAKG